MRRAMAIIAALAALGTASVAAADTYIVVPDSYGYAQGYIAPNTGTYDRNYDINPVPTITNPSGEGGGVQSPY